MDDLKVLVVDDEPGIRFAVARTLSRYTVQLPEVDDQVHGFEVVQAGSGEEALEAVAREKPDIVLLDLKLPGISGLDVLKQLDRDKPDLLTVMITAYATIETAITATKRGAYDLLAKPFTPQELRTVVRKAARHLIAQRKAAQLAREKHQIRFQFISVLAHELKSPLAAVEGFLYLLRDGTLGDELESYEKVVGRALVRTEGMRKLIGDILDLTRLESGQKRRELAEVDLVSVAQMAVETVLPTAEPRDISVHAHMDDAIPMFADRGELEIVLNNLLSNAVKYNRDGGRVDMTLEQNADHVTVRVSDTGIGMTDEECARLGGEFVRIKNEKTRNILGSGLGLSIVRKIAALYGGELRVESEPDVGSTFSVDLRLRSE